MVSPTNGEILKAVADVERAFPFPRYIHGVRETMLHVIPKLYPWLTSGGRLLDIGCGPMDNTAVFRRLGVDCYAIDDLGDEWLHRGDNLKKIFKFAEVSVPCKQRIYADIGRLE